MLFQYRTPLLLSGATSSNARKSVKRDQDKKHTVVEMVFMR
jgi:hypothetical protein